MKFDVTYFVCESQCSDLTPVLFLNAFAKLRKATISFVMSVCPSEWNNSAPTGRTLINLSIFRKSVEKIQVSLIADKNNSTVHEYLYTFFIISR